MRSSLRPLAGATKAAGGARLMPDHVDRDGDPLARHSLSPTELQQLLAAERDDVPFLVFRDRERRLEIFRTGTGAQTWTIGRRTEMDLSIPWDSEVSGLHAELQGIGGEWTIVDDGLSTNGTFVNGQRVGGRRRLRDGDRIRIGQTILAYKSARAVPVIAKTVTTGDRRMLQQVTETQRRVLIALCRPYRNGGSFATPATNQQIADEVFLSVEAVKMHLRTLFAKFELGNLPQNEKRVRLAECALQFGVISQHELE
jgi:pSer/pThr/pTyr-binding forkhead associated (FHA) protein